MTDHNIIQFRNGIRLVHKNVYNTKIVHCGIIFDVGSRDEPTELQGITHFWEHMAFKGTKTRNAYRIINLLESVGGDLNAFTTKEKICFHASVLSEYFERAIKLLTDIAFFSTFPIKEIEKERKVIIDEMMMYEDLPEESIQDDFDTVMFPDHAIGRNILGNISTVSFLKHKHFRDFIRKNLNNRKIVISVVGNVSESKCRQIIEKYVLDLRSQNGKNERIKPVPVSGSQKIFKKNISRSYCAIGFPGYSVADGKRLTLFTLSNILGGPSMNSRLNMELREHRALVYSIDAGYMPYSDIGIVGIYFGTDSSEMEKSVGLVNKELKKLKERKLGKLQLHQAKEQLVGQLAMAEENNISLMIMLGRSILDLDRIDLFEDIIKEIRSITSEKLLRVANEIFRENKLCQLIFEPA